MRAPKKVIAAMAMITLLGGTSLPVFADNDVVVDDLNDGTSDFTTSIEVGKEPLQRTEQHQEDTDGEINLDTLTSYGDIKINGTFSKSINSFPDTTEKGRYLRVTMPLELNYKYDVTKKELISGNGDIKNESVLSKETTTDGGTKLVETEQPVMMTFMGLEDNNSKSSKIEYVRSVNKDEAEKSGKVQVPFGLVITKGAKDVETIPLADLNSGEKDVKSIRIGSGASMNIKIDKFNGQDVVNAGILGDETGSISHRMMLRFEYDGQ